MIFGINTTRDISKLSQISLAILLHVHITILKYHSWYLCQISYYFTNHAVTYTNIMVDELHLKSLLLTCLSNRLPIENFTD